VKFVAVGKRVPRADAAESVAGQTRFAADITLPGMLWGAVLRSPHPHARIRAVRTVAAAKLPGVRAVITGRDFPRTNGPVPVLARDKVRYQGEPVAAVAADTLDQARDALELIEVDYRPLSVITDVRQAVRLGAPLVHDEDEGPIPNLCGERQLKRGDIEAGFAHADHIFEDTFETPWLHQGYLEPHVALGAVDPATGKATVWTTTQAQFDKRADLAHVLDLPMSRLRVIGTPVGGGFGGKAALTVEPLCLELSRRTGRPVKIVMTREEEFLANRPCGAAVMDLRIGVENDGALTALQARLLFDTGAYPGAQSDLGALLVQGPYRIPNLDITSWAVYTNKPSAGARRALTSPHVHFAIESQLDIIAHALGLDPLDIRLKNALREGDLVLGSSRLPYSLPEKVIRAAADRARWSHRTRTRRRAGPKARGIGLAAGHWPCHAGISSAWVHVNEDGSLAVVTGAVNLTGTSTSFAQIAAESFGIPVERVTVHVGDTDTGPRNEGSWGSRVLYGVGETVRRAAEDAKRQLAEALAAELEVSPDHIQVARGRLRAGRRSLSLADAASRANAYRGAVVGRAALSELPFGVSFAAQVAEVEVDRETGQVEVKRLVCAQDVGLAINPMSVEGQIEGAASQGLGYALCEEYIYDEGRLLNPDFMDFRMPTAPDHPQFDIALIEDRLDAGPFGAKGVGEPPLVPTAPAIANAIFDAVGARVCRLPITPERLWREIQGDR
jgi:xanthine dehydrogenase molybdenum-binding subunit